MLFLPWPTHFWRRLKLVEINAAFCGDSFHRVGVVLTSDATATTANIVKKN